jgi:hypothetical protein
VAAARIRNTISRLYEKGKAPSVICICELRAIKEKMPENTPNLPATILSTTIPFQTRWEIWLHALNMCTARHEDLHASSFSRALLGRAVASSFVFTNLLCKSPSLLYVKRLGIYPLSLHLKSSYALQYLTLLSEGSREGSFDFSYQVASQSSQITKHW